MKFTIPFNRPPYTGNEDRHVLAAMRSPQISGDGEYSRLCHEWFEQKLGCSKALLTPSCTQALEMAALLLEIQPGDEVIMSSFTFTSTANAFALRGAKIVFVDIRPDTMNIDETLIEAAVTERTRVIVPMHYAGVACEMKEISKIANRYGIFLVEDAAQGMMASYEGKPLGTLSDLGTYSFHETKNFTSGGEGGLLIVNNEKFSKRAEVIREKGTNRSQFFRGQVDKYSWIDLGSSYLPSDIQAAYLWGQLEVAEQIDQDRLASWRRYREGLRDLERSGDVELARIPANCEPNGHIFYLKTKGLEERTALLDHVTKLGIRCIFHYVPLHSATAGTNYGRFNGEDRYTTGESERLIRLPMWYGQKEEEASEIMGAIKSFYR